jgi:hypothetical protein
VKFTATRCLGSEKGSVEMVSFWENKATTFQSNRTVLSKLIRLELDRNLSNAYVEKRTLDGQLGTGAGTNIAVRNGSTAEHDRRHHVDIHVDIPINRVIFFEFV